MLSARFRLSAAAAVAVLGAGLFLAGPASAAPGTTITLDPSDIVLTSDTLNASGTCAAGSLSAVVSVSQNGKDIATGAQSLDGSLTYDIDLDVTKGTFGSASATVNCFGYDAKSPLGTASAQFLLVADLNFDEVKVTVSPSKVAIGSRFTITGTCAPGTKTATVVAGSGDNDQPFLDEAVTPAADGTVRVTSTLKAGKYVQVGDAGAGVFCGDVNAPAGLGFQEFTITAAAAGAPVPATGHGAAPASPSAPARPAAPARAELAATGSDNGPIALIGSALVLLGLGAHVLRRRADLSA